MVEENEQIDVDAVEAEAVQMEAEVEGQEESPEFKKAQEEIKEIAKDIDANKEKKIIPLIKGVPSPGSVEDLYRECNALFDPATMPSDIRTPKQLFSRALLGARLGMNPLMSVNSIANVHGRWMLHTDGPLAVVMNSGLLDDREEWAFDEKGEKLNFDPENGGSVLDVERVYGYACRVKRKGVERSSLAVFTLGLAKKAGLYPAKKKDGSANPKGPWSAYTDVMLKRRARSLGLKDLFPDVLNGMGIIEYDEPYNREMKDVTPKVNVELEEAINSRSGVRTEPLESNGRPDPIPASSEGQTTT